MFSGRRGRSSGLPPGPGGTAGPPPPPPLRQRRGRTMARPLAVLFTLLAAPALRAAEKPPALPKDLPPYGEDRPLPVPALDESRLPGGLTIWLLKRPGIPRLTAVLATRGGTAADPPSREGVAQVLADTIKEGTT